ncbi:hypothetical protein [Salinispora arenicola]|uniref:hypothetical protein n=1 Tax=Salinispora arenicola TaxID=168697 RepID=UPI0016B6C942|nr:hypothetical protein [Salinispora arenicola]NIL64986.1 hypothetical protein [Salinispora arenicola]
MNHNAFPRPEAASRRRLGTGRRGRPVRCLRRYLPWTARAGLVLLGAAAVMVAPVAVQARVRG